MTRKIFRGPFAVAQTSPGIWMLAAEGPDGVRLYLRGAVPEALQALQDPQVRAGEIEWRADGVTVSVTGAAGVRHVKADSGFMHEPKPRLYDSLPLASFDAGARRFWKRVFRLMRIPGGRLLLGMIARRRRGTASH